MVDFACEVRKGTSFSGVSLLYNIVIGDSMNAKQTKDGLALLNQIIEGEIICALFEHEHRNDINKDALRALGRID